MVAQIPITSSEIKLTVVNVLKLKFYSQFSVEHIMK